MYTQVVLPPIYYLCNTKKSINAHGRRLCKHSRSLLSAAASAGEASPAGTAGTTTKGN